MIFIQHLVWPNLFSKKAKGGLSALEEWTDLRGSYWYCSREYLLFQSFRTEGFHINTSCTGFDCGFQIPFKWEHLDNKLDSWQITFFCLFTWDICWADTTPCFQLSLSNFPVTYLQKRESKGRSAFLSCKKSSWVWEPFIALPIACVCCN